MNLPAYRKTLAAVVTGLLGWATAVIASASGPITAGEWIAGITVVATAFGVFATPNESSQFTAERVQEIADESYRRGKSKKAKWTVESGYTDFVGLIVVLVIVLILLRVFRVI